jgi:hypothetical protein
MRERQHADENMMCCNDNAQKHEVLLSGGVAVVVHRIEL